ncbi:hypothetical protein ACOME3_003221 [Neoechinorhynchus agilis]
MHKPNENNEQREQTVNNGLQLSVGIDDETERLLSAALNGLRIDTNQSQTKEDSFSVNQEELEARMQRLSIYGVHAPAQPVTTATSRMPTLDDAQIRSLENMLDGLKIGERTWPEEIEAKIMGAVAEKINNGYRPIFQQLRVNIPAPCDMKIYDWVCKVGESLADRGAPTSFIIEVENDAYRTYAFYSYYRP